MYKELGIYISSRNNYEMLENEVISYNKGFENFTFINVDDNSIEQQEKLGKEICKRHNIPFVKNSGRGLYMALKTASDWFEINEPSVKFIYWTTHDCNPLTTNLYEKINSLACSRKLDEFGCVGFNTIWKKWSCSAQEFKSLNLEGKYCGTLGRAVLTPVPGVGWYRSSDFHLPWKIWGKTITVESVVDMAFVINLEKFRKLINPDEMFHHFCWGDDLCLQFLKKNVYNVTLSEFYVYHDQSIKSKYKIPESSYGAAKRGDTYHFCQHDRHYERWNKKWGFDRGWQRDLKKLPDSVKEMHKDTLICNFIDHDVSKGPIKTFDLK